MWHESRSGKSILFDQIFYLGLTKTLQLISLVFGWKSKFKNQQINTEKTGCFI